MGHSIRKFIIVNIWTSHSKVRKNDKDKWLIQHQKLINRLERFCKRFNGLMVQVRGHTNGHISYFVAWDGSSEGFSTSTKYDKIRDQLLKFLRKNSDKMHWYVIVDDENMDGIEVAFTENHHRNRIEEKEN